MKSFAVVAAAVCLVAKTFAYSTDPCPDSEIVKLLAIASEPSLPACQDASGYTFVPPSNYPTDDQIQLMCLTAECHTTIAAIQALNPSDCVIAFTGVSLNVKNITDSFEPACKALGLGRR
ncbi:Elicitin, partial [Globisporangium splendens]